MNRNSILIVAARYSNNLGDDVIYDVVSEACKIARGVEPLGVSISGKKGYTENNFMESSNNNLKITVKEYLKSTALFSVYVEKKGAMRLKENLDKLNWDNFDTIVFAGGQLFMDYFVHWIAIIVSYAEKYNKKVVFNCCGMGKLSSKSVKLLSKVLQSDSIYSITIRDGLKQFRSLFESENVLQTIDPAINSANVYGKREKIDGRVGIGIISYKMLIRNNISIAEDEYIDFIKHTIEFFEYHKRKIVVFTNGAIDDYEFAQFALKSIGKEKLLEKRPTRPVELVDVIATCEYIISFRLHSLILAAAYDIPSIGLVWDSKVKSFFETIKREEWAIMLNDGLSFEKLKFKMENLLSINNYKTACSLKKSYDNLIEILKE